MKGITLLVGGLIIGGGLLVAYLIMVVTMGIPYPTGISFAVGKTADNYVGTFGECEVYDNGAGFIEFRLCSPQRLGKALPQYIQTYNITEYTLIPIMDSHGYAYAYIVDVNGR